MGGEALKCKYRISIKVKDRGITRVEAIIDKHIARDVFYTKLQGDKEGKAINGEVGDALSSSMDGKEEALKGRFKVSVKVKV
jgi:hypothetical protein